MSNIHIPRFHDARVATPDPVPAVMPIEAAYHRVRSEIEAVPDDELVGMNVDPVAVAVVVKAAAARLAALRPQFVDELRHFDAEAFDKLADYADALVFVHSEFKRNEAPQDPLPAIYEEALLFRENVVAVGRVLVSLQLLDTTVFDDVGSVIGYRNVGVELFGLCTTLLEKLPEVGPRCPLTPEQLQRGRALANLLIEAVSERNIASEQKSGIQKERQRAFTLLSKRYDEVRRAVAFVRWHEGDADTFAPSFFAGRNAGPRSKKDASTSEARMTSESSEATAEARVSDASATPTPWPEAPDGRPKGDSLFAASSDEPFA